MGQGWGLELPLSPAGDGHLSRRSGIGAGPILCRASTGMQCGNAAAPCCILRQQHAPALGFSSKQTDSGSIFFKFFFIFNSLGPCEVSTHPIKGLVPISWEEGEGWGARLLQPRAICQLGDGDLFFLIN